MSPKGARIDILNGPNLNLLGEREPHIYGRGTLADLEKLCRDAVEAHGFEMHFFQSNSESALVEAMQNAGRSAKGCIVNLAGFSHTSVALLDAAQMMSIPLIEVHISNIFARESFRHQSLISRAARGVICGLGVEGYRLAIDAMASLLSEERVKEKV